MANQPAQKKDFPFLLPAAPGFRIVLVVLLTLASFRITAQCPTISSILVDGCGTEQLNEFIIIFSGNGFLVDELFVDYDLNNNIIGPENNDIHINNGNNAGNPTPCSLQPGNPAVITGCTNIIPVGLGTFIPANAYVVLQTSNGSNAPYDFSAVCSGMQQCVYLIESSCTRSAGGFTNAGAGMRTTVLGLTSGCSNAYTYNMAALTGGNGAYFSPPATYGNGGCSAPPGSFGNAPSAPMISGIPVSVCQNDPSVTLPTLQDGVTGTWSGMGVSGNMFNPAGLSGNVTLTFTPAAGQCATTATTNILVIVPTAPVINGIPASICQNDTPIPLPTNQGGITGTWSGMGVSGNIFNPAGLNGNIILTFTPNAGQCATTATTSIMVTLPMAPMISGIPASVCQLDAPVALPTNQGGITGTWSGMGVSGNTFNPTGLSGNITLTFTPTAGQCATTATTNIMVTLPVTPVVSGLPASMCELDNPIALPNMLSGITGTWSGLGVSGNMFDPGGLGGPVMLTFTPAAGQCANAVNAIININAPSIPGITGLPASMCEDDAPIGLPVMQSGITGTWSGMGVSGNIFSPAGLSGNILLTFTPDAGQCAIAVTAVIGVDALLEPPVSGIPALICEEDDPILLPVVQSGITGDWSGIGVTNNSFDPDGLSGFFTLIFTPDPGQCAEETTTNISVELAEAPLITGIPGSICETAGVINLPVVQSGISGDWSGPGVTGNAFNPNNQIGSILLDFTPDPGQCALPAVFTININEPPSVTSIIETCDPGTLMYTVSFTITGGVPGTYTVNGSPVGSSMFVSSAMVNGSTYLFQMDDVNGCGPVTLTGSVNCSCATSAGTMDFSNTPYLICDSTGFTALHNGNQMLDPDDVFVFILHTNPGSTPGTILATSTTSTFSYPPGIIPGQTYYVSAVAGSDNGMGMIDFNDPCLSVSPGIPVVFYSPTVSISAIPVICENACVTFQLDFTGQPPFSFDFILRAGGNDLAQNWTGVGPSAFILFCPADAGVSSGTLELIPVQLSDLQCVNTTSLPSPAATEVQPLALHIIQSVLCSGTDTLINGTLYSEGMPSGMDTLPGAAANGCDSVIVVDLTFLPEAMLLIQQTLCTGGSITVNGTVYDEANPSGTEVITGGSSAGCDSIIEIDLSFNSVVDFFLEPFICQEDTVYVNGNPYFMGQSTGMELFPGGSVLGCDSVVHIDLQFYPPATGQIDTSICTGDSVVINGQVYDADRPLGTQFFPNGSVMGCDSVLVVNLNFLPAPSGVIDTLLCHGDSIVVNGTIYNALNPAGTEVFFNGSVAGCDSVVIIQLSYYSQAISVFDTILSPGQSIVVNGNVYDMSNPSGMEILVGAGAHGCDSTVLVQLMFTQELSVSLTTTRPVCHGDSNGSIIITEVFGGLTPYEISLNGQPWMPMMMVPFTVTGLPAGNYTVDIRDAAGVTLTQIVSIPDAPVLTVDLGMDGSIVEGQNLMLEPQTNFTPVQWQWSPPTYLSCTDCATPTVVQPAADIGYTVIVTDSLGCSAQDDILIRIIRLSALYAPNVFTPDGDGVNDAFTLFSNQEITQINILRIFNRWGSLLFESGPISPGDTVAGWDGTFHGQPMDPGVYVWWAEVQHRDDQKSTHAGDVTLIR